jgi:hypothetical protein
MWPGMFHAEAVTVNTRHENSLICVMGEWCQLPYPMDKGPSKRFWKRAMNRSKQRSVWVKENDYRFISRSFSFVSLRRSSRRG